MKDTLFHLGAILTMKWRIVKEFHRRFTKTFNGLLFARLCLLVLVALFGVMQFSHAQTNTAWSNPVYLHTPGGGNSQLAIGDDGVLYAAYAYDDIYISRSLDQGRTWVAYPFHDPWLYGGVRDLAVDHHGVLWLLWTSEEDGGEISMPVYINLSRSIDSGRSFSTVFRSLSHSGGTFHQKVGIDADNNVYMLWDDAKFKLTAFPGGDSVRRMDMVIPAGGIIIGKNSSLVITRGPIIHCAWENIIYDSVGYHWRVAYSRWENVVHDSVVTTLIQQEAYPSMDVDSNGVIFISARHYPGIEVLRSVDRGHSFETPVVISGSDTASNESYMCIDSENGINVLWERESGGHFRHSRSSDLGNSFGGYVEIPGLGIDDFIHGTNGELYITGSNGVGVGFSQTNVVLSVSGAHPIPTEQLLSNYPNPFNPMTVVRFKMESAGMLELKVFDIVGREVANLIKGYFGPETHTIPWDASGLSSGMYFLRLTSDSKLISQRKIILAR